MRMLNHNGRLITFVESTDAGVDIQQHLSTLQSDPSWCGIKISDYGLLIAQLTPMRRLVAIAETSYLINSTVEWSGGLLTFTRCRWYASCKLRLCFSKSFIIVYTLHLSNVEPICTPSQCTIYLLLLPVEENLRLEFAHDRGHILKSVSFEMPGFFAASRTTISFNLGEKCWANFVWAICCTRKQHFCKHLVPTTYKWVPIFKKNFQLGFAKTKLSMHLTLWKPAHLWVAR